jgi:hypothetical protein
MIYEPLHLPLPLNECDPHDRFRVTLGSRERCNFFRIAEIPFDGGAVQATTLGQEDHVTLARRPPPSLQVISFTVKE